PSSSLPGGGLAGCGSPPVDPSPTSAGTQSSSGWTAAARRARGETWESLLSTRFTSYLLPVPGQYDQANKKERPEPLPDLQLTREGSIPSLIPYSAWEDRPPPSSFRFTRSTVRQSGQMTSSTESSSSTCSSIQTSSRHWGQSTFR